MTGSARTRLAVLAVLLAVAAAVTVGTVVLVSSGHHTTTSDQHNGDSDNGTAGPQPAGADVATAATGALTTMWSWQPVTDPSPGQGLVRAAPWLAGQMLADAQATTTAPAVRPMREWSDWAAAGDIITALVTITGIGQPERGQCGITATVAQIVQHRDGTRTPWRTMSITASMTSTPAGWRMANYRVTG